MLHVVLLIKQIVYDYKKKKNYMSYNNGLVLIADNIKFVIAWTICTNNFQFVHFHSVWKYVFLSLEKEKSKNIDTKKARMCVTMRHCFSYRPRAFTSQYDIKKNTLIWMAVNITSYAWASTSSFFVNIYIMLANDNRNL